MSTPKSNTLPAGVSPSTLTHFATHPLAQPTLQDPAFTPFPSSRHTTHAGRGHTLSGKTWNTPATISHLLSTQRPSADPAAPYPQPEAVRSEVRRFYTFGTDLNAHPNILHGGVVATILDSTLGYAVGCALGSLGGSAAGMFTVQLSVGYRRVVRTPGTVRVRAWMVGREGRKAWAEGVVECEGDGEGEVVVCARGEGMWMQPRKKEEGKL